MIDANLFAILRQEIHSADEQREQTILVSRDIIHLSKQIIYALHRDQNVAALLAVIEQRVRSLPSLVDSHHNVACQEYVEAVTYAAFMAEQPLPSSTALKVRAEDYVAGLCDLSGELVRKAVSVATKGDIAFVQRIFSFVSVLYTELLELHARGDLRKKIDSVRWNLQKLEDLLFTLRAR